MKKQLLLLVMILLPMLASADAVEIDGIYYNLTSNNGSNNAEVTANPNKYKGSVVIPESVTFENVNYNVTTIGVSAFDGCSSLTSVTIPNSVTVIKSYAFSDCSSLTSVIIPNGVTSIAKRIFYGCSSLKYVTIPNGVTSIGEEAFIYCSSLTSMVIPNSVTSIGGDAFYGCSSLTSINIPNSLAVIESGAFSGCSGLTSVTIPNSVTVIEGYAFKGCSGLKYVTIGKSVVNIYKEAFVSCSELKDVYCHAVKVPNANTNVFEDSYIGYVTLHVPAESIDAYKAASPWRYFGSIIALKNSDPKPDATGINVVRNSEGNKAILFNLNGVRLSEPQKGINIINGKKFVKK